MTSMYIFPHVDIFHFNAIAITATLGLPINQRFVQIPMDISIQFPNTKIFNIGCAVLVLLVVGRSRGGRYGGWSHELMTTVMRPSLHCIY